MPRFIYTDEQGFSVHQGFSPPVEFVHLPQVWQDYLWDDLPEWSRTCVDVAISYVEGVELQSFEIARNDRILLTIQTNMDVADLPSEISEMYEATPLYLAEIFHALEQRVDTGLDGWQWAYGVNQRAEKQHPLMDSSCVMVFSITSWTINED